MPKIEYCPVIPPRATSELLIKICTVPLFSHLLSDFLTSEQFIEPSEQLALSNLSRQGRRTFFSFGCWTKLKENMIMLIVE